jgi:hypothetical protein
MSKEQSDKDFLKFWKHISLGTKDETLIVLKGHLLLEDLMREYCASKVKHEKSLDDAKLSFRNVLHLTKAFQEHQPENWVWAGLSMVNSLRNKLAHNLEPKDYEKKRIDLINLVRHSMKDDSSYEHFPNDYEQVAVSIFMLYTKLSSILRFKPQSPLAVALRDYVPNENSNKASNPTPKSGAAEL